MFGTAFHYNSLKYFNQSKLYEDITSFWSHYNSFVKANIRGCFNNVLVLQS